ncbi:hypothetical protein N2152v2_002564 [Parachlorella kessleri]
MTLQQGDVAAAAAARLAVPTCPLLSSFSQPTTEHGRLKNLEAALRQVAAGSLVATALQSGLQLEGACGQLGTSHAYRLASSIQLLRQQAGIQLQQALQRTVCHPNKVVMFWYTSMGALDALEKAFPGAASQSHELWKVLASLISQLYTTELPPLVGWDSNPRNVKYWNCLQRLPQQGVSVSSCSREKLCQATATCAGSLFIVCRLSLEQGGATPRQLQSCMEALTLGLAALGPLVDSAAEVGPAANAAAVPLRMAAVPALQLLSDAGNQYSRLWVQGNTAIGQEEALGLPMAAAGAAEAALRLAAACAQLAAEQGQKVAAELALPCMQIAEQLGSACRLIWSSQEQVRRTRCILVRGPLLSATVNMGLSAVKLALKVVSLSASARPGSHVWSFCKAIMTNMRAAVDNSYHAALGPFGGPQPPTTQL